MQYKSIFFASAVFLICFSSSVPAAEVTLRMHQFLPAKANVPALILEAWARKIEQDSGNRIKIQHYPSMQLGGTPAQLYDQAIQGLADIVWFVNGYAPGRLPRTQVFELPFMMTNSVAASKAFWQLGEELIIDTDYKDVKVLGLWVHGPGLIHSKEPIKELADLRGVKIRAGSSILNRLFADFGAIPVGMPVPRVPQSLAKGVIDATIVPWEVTTALKIAELVGHHTEFDSPQALYTLTFVLAMNKDKYDALPEDLKKIIDTHSGAEFSAFAGKVMQDTDAQGRARALELGNKIHLLPPQKVAEFRQAAQTTIGNWVADMDAKGLDGTGLLARARELIAKQTEE